MLPLLLTPCLSIPDAIWWCTITMTTVGYGDKFPRTWARRIVAIATMFVGIFFMAMPLTVIGSVFNAAWEATQQHEKKKEIKGLQIPEVREKP